LANSTQIVRAVLFANATIAIFVPRLSRSPEIADHAPRNTHQQARCSWWTPK